jgi:hypothetical protein
MAPDYSCLGAGAGLANDSSVRPHWRHSYRTLTAETWESWGESESRQMMEHGNETGGVADARAVSEVETLAVYHLALSVK